MNSDPKLPKNDPSVFEERTYANFLDQTKTIRFTWLLSIILIASLAGWISVNKESVFLPFSVSPVFATICCMLAITFFSISNSLGRDEIELLLDELYDQYKTRLYKSTDKKSEIYIEPLHKEEWRIRISPFLPLRRLLQQRLGEIFATEKTTARRLSASFYYAFSLVLVIFLPFIALCMGSYYLFNTTNEPLAIGISLIVHTYFFWGSRKLAMQFFKTIKDVMNGVYG